MENPLMVIALGLLVAVLVVIVLLLAVFIDVVNNYEERQGFIKNSKGQAAVVSTVDQEGFAE